MKKLHSKMIKIRRCVPETFLCLCCGGEFSKNTFNISIEGFFQGRREGYLCVCCLLDSRRRAILENEGYVLPVYEDVKKTLTLYQKGIDTIDRDLNKVRRSRKPYQSEED